MIRIKIRTIFILIKLAVCYLVDFFSNLVLLTLLVIDIVILLS
ncbi:hypothetical protein XBFM1_860062 [Xenorhabdus bovienii str. feltiae Moldova]|uniref:Uncharacterized protein n=1 Tax=Xenorhabdus bovienii str. feltiae Moldova TaxID=1398200 RepID=A0A077NZE5_XENBV|nr:hypothetical protein XBFM1_860062 [Xenorhabdus bovienii str. feltiae Moldova]